MKIRGIRSAARENSDFLLLLSKIVRTMNFKKITILLLVLLVADQALKIWIKTHMTLDEAIMVVPTWFQLRFIENNGAAFGMHIASRGGFDWGKLLLGVFRIVMVGFIGWLMHHLCTKRQDTPKGVIVGLALIFPGEDPRKAADVNDAWDKSQVSIYRRKTGLSETVLLHMMADTTYMTGKEAVEKGFANELLDDAEPVEISASADRQTIYAKGHALHLRPGTKLPGNIPMAKAAAPATATANTPAAPAAQSNEGGHTTMATTIEELRKENPELCRQLEQSASEQASQNERTRLSEIDEVANLFDPTMVQEAKYGKTACDARELAFRAAKAAAAQGHEFLKNLAADNQASGAQGVEAVPGASATGDPESLPDATGNAPKTPAERMATADAAVAALLDGDEKK